MVITKKLNCTKITMVHDREDTNHNENWVRWYQDNEMPEGIERVAVENEEHFKWNIENHFKKVNVRNIDEALAPYLTKELTKQAA